MNYDSFLFVGHGTSEKTGSFDPGAINGDITEYNIAKQIVDTTLIYLNNSNIALHVDENNFKDIDVANNTYTLKCGLSVHINAGGGSGCECYVPLKETFFQNDITLLNNISTLLNFPNRGVKSRSYSDGAFHTRTPYIKLQGTDYYGEIREAWQRGISLTLLEVGFIDTNDINKILDNIDKIAYSIACYFCDLAGKQHPATPDNTGQYRVIIDNLTMKHAENLCINLSDLGYKNPRVEYYE